MTKATELPEDAQEEPRILSPQELAEHAWEALEASVAAQERGEHPDFAAANNPLRMPGELSSGPPRPRR